MPNLSKKAALGVAREATSGTAMATPTVWVPQKSVLKFQKKREYLDDERNSRDANYDVVDGTREGMLDPKGAWYNDTSVYFLIAGMGAVSSAQPSVGTDPTVWKHTLALADTPPSLTTFKKYDGQIYYMPYTIVEKWSLKWTAESKLLEFDVSCRGLWPTPYVGSALTPSYSTVKPFAGYAPTISLTGGASSDVEQMQIDFDQKITLWYPSNGLPDFTTVYFGERHLKVDYTARFDNTTIFDRFRTSVDDQLTVDVLGPIISNALHQELNLSIPLIGYDSMEHDLGKDNVLIKAKATARPQSATPLMSAFVQNTVTSYVS